MTDVPERIAMMVYSGWVSMFKIELIVMAVMNAKIPASKPFLPSIANVIIINKIQ